MRLIDADAVIDEYNASCGTISDLIEIILDAPTVDPIKDGEWVKTDYKPMIFTKCSLCGQRVEIQNKSAFCPGCGARMHNA